MFTSIATYSKEQRCRVLLTQNVSGRLSFAHTVNTQTMLFEDKPEAVLHLAIVGVWVKVHIQLGVQKWISVWSWCMRQRKRCKCKRMCHLQIEHKTTLVETKCVFSVCVMHSARWGLCIKSRTLTRTFIARKHSQMTGILMTSRGSYTTWKAETKTSLKRPRSQN